MRMLVVDDNHDRSAALIGGLVERAGISRGDVEVCADGQSAREAMASESFDLLVLDVVLPNRPGDDPDERTAVGLLTELCETSRLKKPRHIIGLTAYADAEKSVARDFVSRSWVLVRQDPLNDDWQRTIESAVSYIRSGLEDVAPAEHGVDVVILTALQLEMDAVRRLPWRWSPDEAFDDTQFISRGVFLSGGEERSVVAAVSSRMGMVSAAVLAAKLINRFRPKLVAMPGICAGVRDKVQLGDVICCDTSWNYQSGKHVPLANALPGFQMDPHFLPTQAIVSARIDLMARDDQLSLGVWNGWNPRFPTPPRLLRGPIASGSAVIADADITESVRRQQRKLLGIEMELYGVYCACEEASRPRPMALGIKGVCDFADDEKNDSAQPYAAYTSAAYLRSFCETYMADL